MYLQYFLQFCFDIQGLQELESGSAGLKMKKRELQAAYALKDVMLGVSGAKELQIAPASPELQSSMRAVRHRGGDQQHIGTPVANTEDVPHPGPSEAQIMRAPAVTSQLDRPAEEALERHTDADAAAELSNSARGMRRLKRRLDLSQPQPEGKALPAAGGRQHRQGAADAKDSRASHAGAGPVSSRTSLRNRNTEGAYCASSPYVLGISTLRLGAALASTHF
jgi:hypothetical protein